ncbi:hypothetical protein QJS04_geneDACA011552 [Acorus gramineus]|uniref:Uncharacterized protein n=1 Tax=Acorus gramineus TaxID=55184 RepID=A0AAV9ABS0_ACOGR|nr:hypothetical protein QJS04_geneDACA011552 [Acorus gramineus]
MATHFIIYVSKEGGVIVNITKSVEKCSMVSMLAIASLDMASIVLGMDSSASSTNGIRHF